MIFIYLCFEIDPQQKVRLFLPLSCTEALSPEKLSCAIRSLPRFLQVLLLLLCYDGLSAEEAAELLELTSASVQARLAYALDLLRRQAAHWVDRGDVQNAFAYAIEHKRFPEEQIRRVRARTEQAIAELSGAEWEDQMESGGNRCNFG